MNRAIIKNFIIYSAGNLLLRLITAGSSFIAVLFLTPKEFGLLSLLNNFISITPVFLNMGLRQAFGLEFFHLNKPQQKQMLHHLICIYLTIAIPVTIFGLIFRTKINEWIFYNQATDALLLIAIAICFLHFFVELMLQVLRYQTQSLKLVLVQGGMALIVLVGNLLLVYFFQLKSVGILFANLIGMLSISLFGLYEYIKKVGFKNFPVFKEKPKTFYYFSLGFPFMPNIIFYWLLSSANRWILAYYAGLEAVGIYALADSFGQLFQQLVLYPLSGSYIPDMLEKFIKAANNPSDTQKLNRANFKLMILSMLSLALIIAGGYLLTQPLLAWIISGKYAPALKYILVILLSQVVYMGTYFSTIKMLSEKRSWLNLGITAISGLANISLSLVLIPTFGINGSIFSSFIGYGTMLTLSLILR